MSKKIISIIIITIILLSMAVFTSCQKEEESSPESQTLKRQMKIEDNDFEDPSYSNEEDGAEISVSPHSEKDFIGAWTARSDKAQYLYGNVDLKIDEDHTWSGNITEESFSGKWVSTNSGIIIRDSNNIINWNLYYGSDGVLLFKNLDDPEISLVLKPAGVK